MSFIYCKSLSVIFDQQWPLPRGAGLHGWLTWSAHKTDLTLRETNKCPESSFWWLLILWSCIPSHVRQSKEIFMICVSCSRFVQPVSQLLYISTLHQNSCWITKKRSSPWQPSISLASLTLYTFNSLPLFYTFLHCAESTFG